MKKLLLAFSLLFITKSISQNYRFSTDVSFQNPSSHNFISDNYNGVIDLGIKYRVVNSKKTKFGISFNAGILKSNRDSNSVAGNFKITSYQLQPKIFTEFNFSHFTPFVGVGYTSMLFRSSTDDRKIYAYNRDGFSLNNTQSGIDLNVGLKYNFEKRLFVQIQYDYIVLGVMEPIINSRYNTNVNILKIGIGADF